MKKVMLMLVAVAFASVVNAASIAWNLDYSYASDGSGNYADGYTAYFFDNSAMSRDTVLSAIAAGDITFKSKALSNAVLDEEGYADVSGVGSFAASSTVTGYLVIFDTKEAKAFVTETESTTIASTGLSAPIGFGDQTDMKAASAWSSVGGSGGGVPEPTSGLLLLVGGALLALRRKQK